MKLYSIIFTLILCGIAESSFAAEQDKFIYSGIAGKEVRKPRRFEFSGEHIRRSNSNWVWPNLFPRKFVEYLSPTMSYKREKILREHIEESNEVVAENRGASIVQNLLFQSHVHGSETSVALPDMIEQRDVVRVLVAAPVNNAIPDGDLKANAANAQQVQDIQDHQQVTLTAEQKLQRALLAVCLGDKSVDLCEILKEMESLNLHVDSCSIENGDTPLIVAARRGDMATVNELIKAGAKIEAKNNNGEDAIDVAGNAKLKIFLIKSTI